MTREEYTRAYANYLAAAGRFAHEPGRYYLGPNEEKSARCFMSRDKYEEHKLKRRARLQKWPLLCRDCKAEFKAAPINLRRCPDCYSKPSGQAIS